MIISSSGAESNSISSTPTMGAEKFTIENISVLSLDIENNSTKVLSNPSRTGELFNAGSFLGSGEFEGSDVTIQWDTYNPFSQSNTKDFDSLNNLYQFNGFSVRIFESGLKGDPFYQFQGFKYGVTGTGAIVSSGFGITGFSTGYLDPQVSGDFMRTGFKYGIDVNIIDVEKEERVSDYTDVVVSSHKTFSYSTSEKTLSGISGSTGVLAAYRSGQLINQLGDGITLTSGNRNEFNISKKMSGYNFYLIDNQGATGFSDEYTMGVSGSRASYGTETGKLILDLTGKLPDTILYATTSANDSENFAGNVIKQTEINIIVPTVEMIPNTGSLLTGYINALWGYTGDVTGVYYQSSATGRISGLAKPEGSRLIYEYDNYSGTSLSFQATSRKMIAIVEVADKQGASRLGKIILENPKPDIRNLRSSVEDGNLKITYESKEKSLGTKVYISNSINSSGEFSPSEFYSTPNMQFYLGSTTEAIIPIKAATDYYAKVIPYDTFSDGEETGVYQGDSDGNSLTSSTRVGLSPQVFIPNLSNLKFEPKEGYLFKFSWNTNLSNYDFDYHKITEPKRVQQIPLYGPISGEVAKSEIKYKITGKKFYLLSKLNKHESEPPNTGYYFSGIKSDENFYEPYGANPTGFQANQELSGINYSFIDSEINRNLKLYRNNTYYFDFSQNQAEENNFYFSLKPIWQQGSYLNEYTRGVSGSRTSTGIIDLTGTSNLDELYFYSAQSGFSNRFSIMDLHLPAYQSEIDNVETGYKEIIIKPELEKEVITGLQYALEYEYSGGAYQMTGTDITRMLTSNGQDTTVGSFYVNNLESSGVRSVGLTVKLLSNNIVLDSKSISGYIPPISIDSAYFSIDTLAVASGKSLTSLYSDNNTGNIATFSYIPEAQTSGQYVKDINIYSGASPGVELKASNLLEPSYIIDKSIDSNYISFLNITGTGDANKPASMYYKFEPVDYISKGTPTQEYNADEDGSEPEEPKTTLFFIENLDSMFLSSQNSKRITFPTALAIGQGVFDVEYKMHYTGSYKKDYVDFVFSMISGVDSEGFNIAFSYNIPDTGYALYVNASAKQLDT